MVNRAKYFQQFANSLNNAFTTVGRTAADLYNKEADSEARLALQTGKNSISTAYAEILSDPAISIDQKEFEYNNRWDDILNSTLEGVNNRKAKEIVSEQMKLQFEAQRGSLLVAQKQLQANNITVTNNELLNNLIDNYQATDRPEQVIAQGKEILGYDKDGKLTDPYMTPAQTQQALQELERDIYIADAQMSIEALIESTDPMKGVQPGLEKALTYISENADRFNERDQRALKDYAHAAFRDMRAKRQETAISWQYEAEQYFTTLEQEGLYVDTDTVNDFFAEAPDTIEMYGYVYDWRTYARDNEDRTAVNDLMLKVVTGEKITEEDLARLHYPLTENQRQVLLNAGVDVPPEPASREETEGEDDSEEEPTTVQGETPASAAKTGTTSSSVGTDVNTLVDLGLGKILESNPLTVKELERMAYDFDVSTEQFRDAVRHHRHSITDSDFNRLLNMNRTFIENETYQHVRTMITSNVSKLYSNLDDDYKNDFNMGPKFLESQLTKLMISVADTHPHLLERPAELGAKILELFNEDMVSTNVNRVLRNIDRLRDPSQLERDMRSLDSYEEFYQKWQEGDYVGMIDNDAIVSYVREGALEDPLEYFAKKMYGVEYDRLNTVEKNLIEIPAIMAAGATAHQKLFRREVLPYYAAQDYDTDTLQPYQLLTDTGFVYVTSDGYAHRANIKGTYAAWQSAYVGQDAYKEYATDPSSALRPRDINNWYTTPYEEYVSEEIKWQEAWDKYEGKSDIYQDPIDKSREELEELEGMDLKGYQIFQKISRGIKMNSLLKQITSWEIELGSAKEKLEKTLSDIDLSTLQSLISNNRLQSKDNFYTMSR